MDHPYRPTPVAVPRCFVRWRRVLALSAQLAFVVLNVACAVFTYAVTSLASDSISATPHHVRPPARAPKRTWACAFDGVVRLDETHFLVSPAFVDRVLEQQSELQTSARFVPEAENGQVVGIRMYGVRPGSLTAQLGFENGDRLDDINGWEMADPEKALEAYARLRNADSLEVGIKRRGVRVVLHYDITSCILVAC